MKNAISYAGLLSAALLLAAPSGAGAQEPAKIKGMKAMGKPNSALGKELKGGAKVDVKGAAKAEAGAKPEADIKTKGKGKGKGKGMKEVAPEVDGRAAAVRARREAWRTDPEGYAKTLRAEQRNRLKAALGAIAPDQAVREALARHARRMARLDWAEETAVEKNDDAALARIDKLREKENARHEKWMGGRTQPAPEPAPAEAPAPEAAGTEGEAQ